MRSSCIVFLIGIVMCAALQTAQAQELPKAPRVEMHSFIFKGRLVGVSFHSTGFGDDGLPVMKLQFSVTEPYAMLNYHRDQQRSGGGGTEVVTDIRFDPIQLNETNYVHRINAALPEPLVLGGEAIVLADWPGARGLELKEIRPATEQAEAQLRQEFREYLLQVRRMTLSSRERAIIGRIRSMENQLALRNEEIRAASPDLRVELERAYRPQIQKLKDGIIADSALIVGGIDEELAKLHEELAALEHQEKAELERRYLNLMIDDLRALREYAREKEEQYSTEDQS